MRVRRPHHCRLNGILALLAVWLMAGVPAIGADDFDAVVAPVIARRCLGCHNPTDKKAGLDLSSAKTAIAGGESGTVLVPGKANESLLWEKVSQDEMPPKKPLAEIEKQVLKRWIEAGANWGADPIDPFKYTSDTRGGYDWWSLKPLKRPGTPHTSADTWARNGIDHFVLAALEAKGLKPSPAADRRTLIRRLTFDLLGLP
ncbi:MAG TPA: c-type cytochrome domain-containing protein, partial [Planctomycetaceae bacterium]|nr:c-type cytochrome domain-containing protein [Planctomycetaceae bacterium]